MFDCLVPAASAPSWKIAITPPDGSSWSNKTRDRDIHRSNLRDAVCNLVVIALVAGEDMLFETRASRAVHRTEGEGGVRIIRMLPKQERSANWTEPAPRLLGRLIPTNLALDGKRRVRDMGRGSGIA